MSLHGNTFLYPYIHVTLQVSSEPMSLELFFQLINCRSVIVTHSLFCIIYNFRATLVKLISVSFRTNCIQLFFKISSAHPLCHPWMTSQASTLLKTSHWRCWISWWCDTRSKSKKLEVEICNEDGSVTKITTEMNLASKMETNSVIMNGNYFKYVTCTDFDIVTTIHLQNVSKWEVILTSFH